VVSFALRPLHLQGKSPWYPLDRRLGGPQSRSGYGVEEKNSQTPPANEPRPYARQSYVALKQDMGYSLFSVVLLLEGYAKG